MDFLSGSPPIFSIPTPMRKGISFSDFDNRNGINFYDFGMINDMGINFCKTGSSSETHFHKIAIQV